LDDTQGLDLVDKEMPACGTHRTGFRPYRIAALLATLVINVRSVHSANKIVTDLTSYPVKNTDWTMF
jgi:hypothetical protein